MWWFVFGLVLGGCRLIIMRRKGAKKIRMTWYEWVMGIASLILILLVLQNFIGSVAEEEPRAAWMGVLFLGIPAVILGVLAVRLPLQRQVRSRV